jgi:hypothetical protein
LLLSEQVALQLLHEAQVARVLRVLLRAVQLQLRDRVEVPTAPVQEYHNGSHVAAQLAQVEVHVLVVAVGLGGIGLGDVGVQLQGAVPREGAVRGDLLEAPRLRQQQGRVGQAVSEVVAREEQQERQAWRESRNDSPTRRRAARRCRGRRVGGAK